MSCRGCPLSATVAIVANEHAPCSRGLLRGLPRPAGWARLPRLARRRRRLTARWRERRSWRRRHARRRRRRRRRSRGQTRCGRGWTQPRRRRARDASAPGTLRVARGRGAGAVAARGVGLARARGGGVGAARNGARGGGVRGARRPGRPLPAAHGQTGAGRAAARDAVQRRARRARAARRRRGVPRGCAGARVGVGVAHPLGFHLHPPRRLPRGPRGRRQRARALWRAGVRPREARLPRAGSPAGRGRAGGGGGRGRVRRAAAARGAAHHGDGGDGRSRRDVAGSARGRHCGPPGAPPPLPPPPRTSIAARSARASLSPDARGGWGEQAVFASAGALQASGLEAARRAAGEALAPSLRTSWLLTARTYAKAAILES